MKIAFSKHIMVFLITYIFVIATSSGQNKSNANISGFLSIDDTWEPIIFLSHIPTFDDMYVMSNEMIIAKTVIDSLGFFQFKIDFLPIEDNLYRLHIVKKGDTPATLIIGGKDENHFFIIANRSSQIKISNKLTSPPFRELSFINSKENYSFNKVNQMIFIADSVAAESSASKRLFIKNQLNRELLLVADTSNIFLVSLFAVYKSNFNSNDTSNMDFYKSYFKRWRNLDNSYIISVKNQLPIKNKPQSLSIFIILAMILSIVSYSFIRLVLRKTTKIKSLSIQERKIFELLQEGASNQEISNHFNIGLSTVKSHVSNIYSKLKVKSRKDIINMK